MRTVAAVALGFLSLAGPTLGIRLAVAQDGTNRPDSATVATVANGPERPAPRPVVQSQPRQSLFLILLQRRFILSRL